MQYVIGMLLDDDYYYMTDYVLKPGQHTKSLGYVENAIVFNDYSVACAFATIFSLSVYRY